MTRITRRGFLGRSLGASLGLLLARDPLALAAPRRGAPVRRLILLWLDGGPSQLETFDPKPGTLTGGPTRAIETAVRGLQFAEHLPALAERADRLTVIRSLSSREGEHERARYLLHTGYARSTTIQHPSLGSLFDAERRDARRPDVPGFVCLGPDPTGPGYAGVSHAPYVVDGADALLSPYPGLDADRRASRRDLLATLEAPFADRVGLEVPSARLDAMGRAAGILHGPLRAALDVDAEDAATRARYGVDADGEDPDGETADWGRRVLAARRLIEAGVSAVEVHLGGWDHHEGIFQEAPRAIRALDRAFAALLDDLAARDLLDSTLVLCLGEFGRTPEVNDEEGRDHYAQAFSAVLAGGGAPEGRVIGATPPDGRGVAERPVSVPDLLATVTTLLQVDPQGLRYAGERPITLVDPSGAPLPEVIG
jgi:uncharacterized protein (DUF1501 family)